MPFPSQAEMMAALLSGSQPEQVAMKWPNPALVPMGDLAPRGGYGGGGSASWAFKSEHPLASYRDKQGYTAVTVAKPGEQGRQGEHYIISPRGEVRQGGYWMDYPEASWGFGNPTINNQKYMALPIQERLSLEAKHQATAYKPLSEQFLSREAVKEYPFTLSPGE